MKEAENRKKKYILYNSIGNSKTWKLVYIDSADWWFAGAGMGVREGWEGGAAKGQGETSGVVGVFFILNEVMITRTDTYNQGHQAVRFKY